MQPADHRADSHIRYPFGDPEDLLDPMMVTAVDQDQAEAADMDHQGLLGDVPGPEQPSRYRPLVRSADAASDGLYSVSESV